MSKIAEHRVLGKQLEERNELESPGRSDNAQGACVCRGGMGKARPVGSHPPQVWALCRSVSERRSVACPLILAAKLHQVDGVHPRDDVNLEGAQLFL